MAILTIFHNESCSKSRATLALLREAESAGARFQVVNYLETPPTAQMLDGLLKALGGLEPLAITRTQEDVWTELGHDKVPPKDRAAWLAVLSAHPILIERPIVTDGTKAIIGRPPERVRELLK